MAPEDFKRKLTAIFSADVAGYSRLMGDDESATVRTLETYKQVMYSLIRQHRGRVVDSPGDNVLAEFTSVVDSVQCAVAVQKEFQTRNAELPENRRMEFRIGINLGDVIEEEDRIYGDGVNIAARLEALADPGGICISKTAFDHIETKLPLGYHYLGEQTVKNIARPVGAYKVLMEPRITVEEEEKGVKATSLWQIKGVLAGAVAFLVVILAVAVWHFYPRVPKIEPASKEKMAFPLPDKPSIAVLPFANMSEDPKRESLADGISENIISALSKVHKLFVIARNSSFTYKGKPVKVQEVAEGLGVRYILEGSVQVSGNSLRITAQLIDAVKGHHLWSQRYDRKLKDIFILQDDIAMEVVAALQVKLTDGERARLAAKGTENLEAYLKLLEASEQFFTVTREGNALARRLLEEILALDPKFPAAYVLLGGTYFMDVPLGLSKSPKESYEQAFQLTEKAIDLDKSFATAYPLLGWLHVIMWRQYDQGLAECEKAIALSPSLDVGYIWKGFILAYAGRPTEAVQFCEQALRLNPIPPGWFYRALGIAYSGAGNYDEAIAAFKESLRRTPNDILTHEGLTVAYSWAGRLEEARTQAGEVLRINPKFSVEESAKRALYKNQADQKRYLDGLRKAGLPETTPLPLPDKPSIVVLPFVNMSGDPEQEYLSDGLTEEIITALSKTSKLFVIARTSAFKYKGKEKDVRTVGREMGVRYVLEGSVRKAGNNVRITAQLIDASTGNHIWAERYKRPLKEIFAIQDEITLAIVRAMRVSLTEGEQARLIGKGTKNLDAYLKAMQAQEQFHLMNNQGSVKAKEFAKAAIADDPNYAFPYATLANAHMLDAWFRFSKSSEESMRLAAEAAEKALALDDSDPTIYSTLSNLYVMQRQYDKAITAAERGLQINPGGAQAHLSMGTALKFACRFVESIPFYEQAIRLNPYPGGTYLRALGGAYSGAGRYDEAISAFKKALQLNPNDIFTHLSLAGVYVKVDRIKDARAEAKEVLRIHPKFSVDHFARTLSYKDQSVVDRFAESLRKAGLK